MAKRLSEQLADLSVRAKSAEQALDAAEKEAHEKIAVRKEQAHASATKAVEKVNQEVKSANDTATRNWAAVKAKIADDMSHLKTDIAHKMHERDVKRADKPRRPAGVGGRFRHRLRDRVGRAGEARRSRCRRRPPGRRRSQASIGAAS